jgi:hypothetical protein
MSYIDQLNVIKILFQARADAWSIQVSVCLCVKEIDQWSVSVWATSSMLMGTTTLNVAKNLEKKGKYNLLKMQQT